MTEPASIFSKYWELLLLLLTLLLLAAVISSESILAPAPPPAMAFSSTLPELPELVQWQQPIGFSETDLPPAEFENPFRVSFVFPPEPAPEPPPEPVAAQPEPEPPPPPPPKHLLTVRFTGVYGNLSGKTFALVHLKDSLKGEEHLRLEEDDVFSEGCRVRSISTKRILLETPEGEKTLKWLDELTITLPN